MKNTQGLPMLDAIEVKQRDRQYKLQQARFNRRAKQLWKSVSSPNSRLEDADLEAIEDQLDIV